MKIGKRAQAAATESQEQRMLAQWLDYKGLLWCHPPNGRARDVVTAHLLRMEGVKPGVPDVLVFTPPRPTKRAPWKQPVGVAIELKSTMASARSTAVQKAWLDKLRGVGWVAFVAKGASDAIQALTELYP